MIQISYQECGTNIPTYLFNPQRALTDTIIPILQMRKLKLRNIKKILTSHMFCGQ